MCPPSAMKGLVCAHVVPWHCEEAGLSRKAEQKGRHWGWMQSGCVLLLGGDIICCLFSAVKTCTEALQDICWCYWQRRESGM